MSNENNNPIDLLRRICGLFDNTASSSTSSSTSNSSNTSRRTNSTGSTIPQSRNTSSNAQAENHASTSTSQLSSPRQTPVEEHRRLFTRQSRIQPYGGRRATTQRTRPSRKEKFVTKKMFCLADKDQINTPSSAERLELMRNDLGEKRVSIPSLAQGSGVKDVIIKAYPVLSDCGGFQLLLSKEKPKNELRIVSHGACSAEELRCFGSGRIYIRPLQRNINLNVQAIQEEFEECLSCFISYPVSKMREHIEECVTDYQASSNEESDVGTDIENDDGSRMQLGSDNDVAPVAPVPVITISDVSEDGNERRSLTQTSMDQFTRDDVQCGDHLRQAINSTLSNM